MKENNPNEVMEFLFFRLGKEAFILETCKVKEVLKFTSITEVPNMPEDMPGVINLRGNVVSLIDISLILGMDGVKDRKTSWFVITEVSQNGEPLTIGMMVDSVEDVIRIKTSRISPAPEIGLKIAPEFIRGIGKQDDNYFIILDIDKIESFIDLEIAQMAVSKSK